MSPNKKLLIPLRNALKALDQQDWQGLGFNLAVWAEGKLPETPELGCGTTCCACGVRITLPEWQEAGLELAIEGLSYIPRTRDRRSNPDEILGLTLEEWAYIFYPSSYEIKSLGQVAQHIDQVLNQHIEDDGNETP